MKPRILTPKERREADRARAKRAALKALKKARKAADLANVKLSDWEGEFLGSVEIRVERYGKAFRDPEKGGPGAALSMLQAQKLKEIGAKAKGQKTGLRRKGFGAAR
jgi:hypothetical protein